MSDRAYPLHVPTEAEVNDPAGSYEGNTNVEPMISLLNYYAQFPSDWAQFAGRDVDTYVCDLLTHRIATLTDLEDDDWTSQTISDALEISHEDDFSEITNAARIAFDDPTESGHAAHIRDALREN